MSKIKRKDILLYLFYAINMQPISGRTRLQKLLFLLDKEHKLAGQITPKFDFQPWKFGPFSAELLRDLEFLENVRLIKSKVVGAAAQSERGEQDVLSLDYMDDSTEYSPDQFYVQEEFSLTDDGARFVSEKIEPRLPNQIRTAIESTKKKYSRLSLSSLLRYVYSKYPRYAAKSELTHFL